MGTRKFRRTYSTIPSTLPLSLPLGGTAEPVVDQVVGLQLSERPATFTLSVSQYLGHRQPGIVVQDAPGHSAQEGEG